MPKPYVIYYGWLTDDEDGEPNDVAHGIAAVRAPLLIAQSWTAAPERHRNISPQLLALMHGAGTEVFAYVATGNGKADLREVEESVAEYLTAGVDGIFFDEADSLVSGDKLPYYESLAQSVRNTGKTVILNPGVSQCGEQIMQVADRVMVEHQWRTLARLSPWMARYGADRFMGVSSNEGNAMGYFVDQERAIRDTREAWQAGVGWHTSTNLYIELPGWFTGYMQAIAAA